jgi:hypothetical protein
MTEEQSMTFANAVLSDCGPANLSPEQEKQVQKVIASWVRRFPWDPKWTPVPK